MRRLLCLVVGLLPMLPGTADAQNSPQIEFGAPCAAGQFSLRGFLLVCDAGTLRYALPEDIPPAPDGGYTERPAWYPRLGEVMRATNPPVCPLTGRVTFTNPMILPEDLLVIVPQGGMVGDHVTPIDHGYIGVRPLVTPPSTRTDADYVPIFAPADGEVIEVSLLGSPTSIRIVLAHGCETYTIFMVVNRLSGALAYLQDDLMARGSLTPHIRLLAGEEFGSERDNPVDFSVNDGASWLSGFVSPFSYAEGEASKPYTVDPWPYFSPDLAALYESHMQRAVAPRWGRIDLDVAGTAAGNWFHSSTLGYSGRSVDDFRYATRTLAGGPVEGKTYPAWSHLSLVPHWVQPGRWMFSIGWWRDERGDPVQLMIDIAAGQPDPSQLTPASGVVVYRLMNWTMPASVNNAPQPIGYDVFPTSAVGIVGVQVNSDETLTIEPVPGATNPATFTQFSAASRTYRR